MKDQDTRNLFAAFAMMGLLSHQDGINAKASDFANRAFAIADAMISESNKNEVV